MSRAKDNKERNVDCIMSAYGTAFKSADWVWSGDRSHQKHLWREYHPWSKWKLREVMSALLERKNWWGKTWDQPNLAAELPWQVDMKSRLGLELKEQMNEKFWQNPQQVFVPIVLQRKRSQRWMSWWMKEPVIETGTFGVSFWFSFMRRLKHLFVDEVLSLRVWKFHLDTSP